MAPADKLSIPILIEVTQDRSTPRTASILGTAASILLHFLIFVLLFVASKLPINPHPVQTLPVIKVNLMSVGDAIKPLSHAINHYPGREQINRSLPATAEKVLNDRTDQEAQNPGANHSVTLPLPVPDNDKGLHPGTGTLDAEHTGAVDETTGTRKNASPKTDDTTSLIPRSLHTPSPLYPVEARRKGLEGLVLLSVVILENGQVGQVLIKKTSGYVTLDRSAMAAVQTWRFEPLHKGNVNRSMIVDVPIRFSLKEN